MRWHCRFDPMLSARDFSCSSTILVGTKSSDIYEIVRLTGRMTQLSTSHCTDELWGLAPHPVNNDVFITCGDDRTVRLWSVAKKRQLAMVVQDNMMRVRQHGKRFACGLCWESLLCPIQGKWMAACTAGCLRNYSRHFPFQLLQSYLCCLKINSLLHT